MVFHKNSRHVWRLFLFRTYTPLTKILQISFNMMTLKNKSKAQSLGSKEILLWARS